jgi:hypothetical protein
VTPDPRTGSPIDYVKFYVDGVDDYAEAYAYPPASGNVYTVTWYAAPLGLHTLTAVAYDDDGYSAVSAARSFRIATPPTPPTLVEATAGSNGTASLRWSPATQPAGNLPVTKYKIQTGTTVLYDTSSPFTFPGLTNGKTYTFTVAAVNAVWSSTTKTTSNAVMPGTRMSLTQTLAPTTIVYGQKATITGTLKRLNTSPATLMGGRPVQLLSCPHLSTTCTVVATANTGTSGTALGVVKFTYGPTAHRDVKLRFLPSAQYLGVSSTAKYLQVKVLVTSAISRTSVPYGGTAVVSGYVKPAHSQSVLLQRYYSGAWHDMGYLQQSSTGYVSVSLRPPARATYPFRLYFPGDSDHLGNYSPTQTLRVY